MPKFYLDTSIILKRYITEEGTDAADKIFEMAETGEAIINFSLWNIGETLGVLDEKRRKGWLTESEFERTRNLFADELVKLLRLKTLEIMPVQTAILTNTWTTIMNQHVYEADALQIITCAYTHCDALLTNDEKLAQTGRKAGLKTIDMSKDREELKNLIQPRK